LAVAGGIRQKAPALHQLLQSDTRGGFIFNDEHALGDGLAVWGLGNRIGNQCHFYIFGASVTRVQAQPPDFLDFRRFPAVSHGRVSASGAVARGLLARKKRSARCWVLSANVPGAPREPEQRRNMSRISVCLVVGTIVAVGLAGACSRQSAPTGVQAGQAAERTATAAVSGSTAAESPASTAKADLGSEPPGREASLREASAN